MEDMVGKLVMEEDNNLPLHMRQYLGLQSRHNLERLVKVANNNYQIQLPVDNY